MRRAEFSKLTKPYRERIAVIRKEMQVQFKDYYVDEEDPKKRLSEAQANWIEDTIEGMLDAEHIV